MKSISDQNSEARVITQFTQGIHSIIVRNSVKQYINTYGDHSDFESSCVRRCKVFRKRHRCRRAVLQTNSNTAMSLKRRQDPATKLSVCYLINPEQPKAAHKPKPIERKIQDQG